MTRLPPKDKKYLENVLCRKICLNAKPLGSMVYVKECLKGTLPICFCFPVYCPTSKVSLPLGTEKLPSFYLYRHVQIKICIILNIFHAKEYRYSLGTFSSDSLNILFIRPVGSVFFQFIQEPIVVLLKKFSFCYKKVKSSCWGYQIILIIVKMQQAQNRKLAIKKSYQFILLDMVFQGSLEPISISCDVAVELIPIKVYSSFLHPLKPVLPPHLTFANEEQKNVIRSSYSLDKHMASCCQLFPNQQPVGGLSFVKTRKVEIMQRDGRNFPFFLIHVLRMLSADNFFSFEKGPKFQVKLFNDIRLAHFSLTEAHLFRRNEVVSTCFPSD
ncbi:hypothetical protein EGR_09652 [Echinococcus granulosus]|uniref:Uncharacterized protein n=1 Tax=Echinococcus granulosus TaxID=6210 RepID=W6U316_ECHGR|nr:hypothetical protein EGR_09652 [Echinococcus granulosus]EUB55478.1 hypothetical protein EGR_09652 [Echinococcus granulosus]